MEIATPVKASSDASALRMQAWDGQSGEHTSQVTVLHTGNIKQTSTGAGFGVAALSPHAHEAVLQMTAHLAPSETLCELYDTCLIRCIGVEEACCREDISCQQQPDKIVCSDTVFLRSRDQQQLLPLKLTSVWLMGGEAWMRGGTGVLRVQSCMTAGPWKGLLPSMLRAGAARDLSVT